MNTIIHIISSIPFLMFVGLSTIISVFFYWLHSDNFRYAMFAYRNKMALGSDYRGKLAKLENQSDDDKEDEYGLVSAERTLCSDFDSIIAGTKGAGVSKKQFERDREYLTITGQNEIKNPRFFAKLGLFVLILAESVGTGYVLAPWMSTEITPSQANLAAGVLAIAVSIILALLTHISGSMLAQYIRFNRKGAGSQGDQKNISRADDQLQDAYYIDKSRKDWVVEKNPDRMRFKNRVQDPGMIGLFVTSITTALIIALMVGIFVVRVEGVNQATEKKIVSVEQNGLSEGGSNPFALDNVPSLPPDVMDAQQQSRKKVAKSLSRDYQNEGIAASLILSLIYAVTQFTAFIIAYMSSFSGQGKSAYEFTMGEPSFDTFRSNHLNEKIKKVDGLLSDLRKKRQGRHRSGVTTFSDYLKKCEHKDKDIDTRQQDIEKAAKDIACLAPGEEKYTIQYEVSLKNHNFSVTEQETLNQNIQRIVSLRDDTIQKTKNPQISMVKQSMLELSEISESAKGRDNKQTQTASPKVPQDRLDVMCGEVLDQPDKDSRIRKKGEVISALRMLGQENPEELLFTALAGMKNKREEERKKWSAEQDLDALLGDD